MSAADVLGDTDRYAKFISHRVQNLRSNSPVLDSEDIRQAAFEGLCRAAVRFRPEPGASLETYAYLPVRGAAVDEIRRINGTRRTVRVSVQSLDRERPDQPIDEPADVSDDPLDLAVAADLLRAIREELRVMPEPHRGLVVLLVEKNLTVKGAADVLEISPSRAADLRHEALEWLRFRLEHRGAI